MEEQTILRGTVAAVVYQNPENGYTVMRLSAEDGESVTVTGTVPQVNAGERLVITGMWSKHPSYGVQFKAEVLERMMPETETEILGYLSAGTVKGIGAKTAQKIVSLFHGDTLDVLEREPERLSAIPGISLQKAKQIGESFRSQLGMRRLVEYLTAHALPAELAVRLYRAYGDHAMDAIEENPYFLTEPLLGAGFAQVDAFALDAGILPGDPRRVEAGVLFELRHNLGNGHTFLPADKVAAATAMLLSLEPELIESAMDRLNEMGCMVTEPLLGLRACYLPELYEAETYVRDRVAAMVAEPVKTPVNLARLLGEVEQTAGMRYCAEQKDAIATAAGSRLMILTGGPGTGKSTTVNGMLALFDRMQLTTLLSAPTGRAAKRLQEISGRDASTIHRLLEAQFSPETGMMEFTHDESEPLKLDALVVDECSMVDIELMASLLRALPPRCRLILVGDPDQLPSVGPGNVLSDLIRSGVAPTVRLTEIFRQAQKSLIVMNAHAVNQGKMPELGVKDRDFFFMRRRDAQTIVPLVCELCAERLPKNMKIPTEDIQVLTPSRRYETGTKELNKALQAVLNPPSPEKREKNRGDFLLREGDRVMQIRNNYDILWKKADGTGTGAGVFNGDIGTVREINPAAETLTIAFEDRIAIYAFELLPELELAYAMTVHKAQGSEYRAVVLVCSGGAPMLRTRSVLYTAITRARELLVLVGDEHTISVMTANDRRQKRYSGLKVRLQNP
ncbi:MAG: ATP-dependent RecD-like DNA helicase [Oscillospiraceae bacterium]|nr:ATP-dependent RecD-like DNA helicase [Oscillospiraceae bacterium]